MKRPRRWAASVALTAALLLAGDACAHERSASYSTWLVDADGADVSLRIEGRDLTRPVEAAIGPSAVDKAVVAALSASRGGRSCGAQAAAVRHVEPGGRVLLRWRVTCPERGAFALASQLPALLAAPHLAFTKIEIPDVGAFEVVLHADGARWQQPERGQSRRGPVFAETFRLGLGHIAAGIDHLFFVFGLVVAAATLGEVLVVVTAFTAAHALTLAAAALGWLSPAAPSVEALIAASIALLAVENLTLRAGAVRSPSYAAVLAMLPALVASAGGVGRVPLGPVAGIALFAACYLALAAGRPDARRLRWLVAFAFGLLHGLGFAGALVEAGFAKATLAATLVAFHAGIEAGQLLFVASVWPLLGLARRRGERGYRRFVLEPASVVLLAAAVAWYAAAAFG